MTGSAGYQASEPGLAKRPLDEKKPAEFEEVFRWDQPSRAAPTRGGFKYYRAMNEPGPVRRFWKTHISAAFSGEVLLETAERARVMEILRQRGVQASRATIRKGAPRHRKEG